MSQLLEEKPAASPSADLADALMREARDRQRKRRRALAVTVLIVIAASATAVLLTRTSSRSITVKQFPGTALCVAAPDGWKVRARQTPGQVASLDMTNFAFGRADYLGGHSDHKLHWPHNGILITIHDWTPDATQAMKPQYVHTEGPLRIAAKNFGSFEGVSNLGIRQVSFHKRLLELWVQARPTTAATIAAANHALARVDVCG